MFLAAFDNHGPNLLIHYVVQNSFFSYEGEYFYKEKLPLFNYFATLR